MQVRVPFCDCACIDCYDPLPSDRCTTHAHTRSTAFESRAVAAEADAQSKAAEVQRLQQQLDALLGASDADLKAAKVRCVCVAVCVLINVYTVCESTNLHTECAECFCSVSVSIESV